jgi:hypothetical protein
MFRKREEEYRKKMREQRKPEIVVDGSGDEEEKPAKILV